MNTHDYKINRQALGLVFPKGHHAGYTNATLALLSAYKLSQTAEITDLNINGLKRADMLFPDPGFNWGALRKIDDAIETGAKFDIVTAGPVGLEFMLKSMLFDTQQIYGAIARRQIRLVWVSEKFYDIDSYYWQPRSSPFVNLPKGSLTMLVPEYAKQRYMEKCPPKLAECIRFGEIDCMASEDKDKLLYRAYDDFEAQNTGKDGDFDAKKFVDDLSASYFFQLGGGLKTETGKLIQNDPCEFARMAQVVAEQAKGGNILVATHGLRTFENKSDKAFNKFRHSLHDRLAPGQTAHIFGQNYNAKREKIPTLFNIKGANPNFGIVPYKGNAYGFLCVCAKMDDLRVGATSDQAMAICEWGDLNDGDYSSFSYFPWSMSDEEANYNAAKVEDKAKSGVKPIDSRAALLTLETISTGRDNNNGSLLDHLTSHQRS